MIHKCHAKAEKPIAVNSYLNSLSGVNNKREVGRSIFLYVWCRRCSLKRVGICAMHVRSINCVFFLLILSLVSPLFVCSTCNIWEEHPFMFAIVR